jgi:hypothetical protein
MCEPEISFLPDDDPEVRQVTLRSRLPGIFLVDVVIASRLLKIWMKSER